MRSRPDPEAFRKGLEDFLHHELEVPRDALRRDEALASSGLMDSMDLVRLANHLEHELGIQIPDRDIHAENFDSIAKILTYVERRLAE